jgi:hypothetical protein
MLAFPQEDTVKRLLVVFILVTIAVAGQHAPLSSQLLSAKTVYIDNESGRADIADKTYQELTKWGRFKVVDDPKSADIVFRIIVGRKHIGATATTTDSGYGANTNVSDDYRNFTTIEVVQPTTGQIFWSDTRNWHLFGSATKDVVKEQQSVSC